MALSNEIMIFANNMAEIDYLPSTWAAYAAEVEEAREIMATFDRAAKLSRYQYQVNDAEMAVVNAKAALVKKVDFYKPITDAIAATESLVEENYTRGSWANLQLAINAGNSLMVQISEDATAVANAATAIANAQGDLIDATVLGPIYDAQYIVENLNSEDYTAASWAVVTEKYNAATDVINNYSADEAKINEAATNLENAIDALIYIKELKEAIATTVEDSKYYTEDSYAEYTAKLEAANTALTATAQTDVDTAKDNLLTAIDGLKYMVANEQELENAEIAIEAADAEVENYYTEDTWNEFADALAAVKALDANSTKLEVDTAMAALELAQSKLVKAGANEDDYAALESVIDYVESLDSEDYVADTWNTVAAAVESALALSDSETREDVEAARFAIEDALKLLVETPDDNAEEDLDEKIDNLDAKGKLAVALVSKRNAAQSNKNMSAIVDALA